MRRAHRSAFVLILRGLRGPALRAAAFDWYKAAVREQRGTGAICKELKKLGVVFTFTEFLWAHYPPEIVSVNFGAGRGRSPFLSMIKPRRQVAA